MITKTTNPLNYDGLTPVQFETVCLELFNEKFQWHRNLEHFGAGGQDGGIDLYGIEEEKNLPWVFQCKRVKSLSGKKLLNVVEDVVDNYRNGCFCLVASCTISKESREKLRNKGLQIGFSEVIIFGRTELERELYLFPEILEKYFGVHPSELTEVMTDRIRSGAKMKKEAFTKLLHGSINEMGIGYEQAKIRFENPEIIFKDPEVIVVPINDTTYPRYYQKGVKKSRWYGAYFNDIYHNGIELNLSATQGQRVAINKTGHWFPLDSSVDYKQYNEFKIYQAKKIGRIPYSSIKIIDLDGDPCEDRPVLYCDFEFDDWPYEEIIYQPLDENCERLSFWPEFNPEMQIDPNNIKL